MKAHPIAFLIQVLIRVYQAFSLAIHRAFGVPDGGGCRFSPTCSEYTIQAIETHGVLKGSAMGMKRLAKCHPWGTVS